MLRFLRIGKWSWIAGWVLLSLISARAQTSLCDGNRGENIFTSGDFGSGPANILATDPGLAPGFIYTTQVPPDDGEYTLTQDMSAWPYVFPAWIRPRNNSPDPNGYMMVVNAGFTPGIFYEQQIDSLCDNTRYVFSADIINLIRMGVTGHILPNVSFLLDGVVVYTTGSIPQDNQWNTYGFTFQTQPGQTSVRLTLRNNAPGGTGNDLALDNIQFRACGPEAQVGISKPGPVCEEADFPVLEARVGSGDVFLQWQRSLDGGMTWIDIPEATDSLYALSPQPPGTYLFRYLVATTAASLQNAKCRTVSDEYELEVIPVRFPARDTICEGLTYSFGDTLLQTAGTYTHVFPRPGGCDSLVELELIIVPDPGIMADFGTAPPSCEGAADGQIYLASVTGTRPPFSFIVNDSIIPPPSTAAMFPAGTYTVRIEDPAGCADTDTVVIPEGQPFALTLIGETELVLGYTTELTAQTSLPAQAFSWTPAAYVSCPFCAEVLVAPVQDQTFTVTATSPAGCVDSASITIRVDRTPVIYLPNVFTPNGDGINDALTIGMDPVVVRSLEDVVVLDRWGNVFRAHSFLSGAPGVTVWDGTTPWGPANPGVYVLIFQARLADNTLHSYSSDITLIR